jgi:hypothetical protein
LDLPRQPVASAFGILNSMDIVLQHDLLRRMIKAHRGEPASICQGPGASPVVNPVVTQQKALQMLPRLRQRSHRCRPRAHQIAHRFMSSVGYPDRRQFAGTMQLRQHQSVTAIGLDPVARLHRNQRWCHHDAVVPQPGQQTVKSISTRTGFVAEVEATPMLAKPSNHFAQDVGAVLEYQPRVPRRRGRSRQSPRKPSLCAHLIRRM